MKFIKEIISFIIIITNITYPLRFQWRNITQVFVFTEVVKSARHVMMNELTSTHVVVISEITNLGNL